MFMTVIMRSWCFCADGGCTWGSNPLHFCHSGTERLAICCSTRWFHASASLCDAGSSSSSEISLLLFVGSDPHRTSELMVHRRIPNTFTTAVAPDQPFCQFNLKIFTDGTVRLVRFLNSICVDRLYQLWFGFMHGFTQYWFVHHQVLFMYGLTQK